MHRSYYPIQYKYTWRLRSSLTLFLYSCLAKVVMWQSNYIGSFVLHAMTMREPRCHPRHSNLLVVKRVSSTSCLPRTHSSSLYSHPTLSQHCQCRHLHYRYHILQPCSQATACHWRSLPKPMSFALYLPIYSNVYFSSNRSVAATMIVLLSPVTSPIPRRCLWFAYARHLTIHFL